jgi:hypothetical protein
MKGFSRFLSVKVSDQGVKFGNAWYSHEGITGYSAEQLNQGNCHITGQQYLKWLNSESPVPPAGDVEVRRYHVWNDGFGQKFEDDPEGNSVSYLDFKLHVTRLTAERDAFKDERNDLVEENDVLQSELTKARELLGGMLFAFDDGVGKDWSAPLLDEARKFCPAVPFKGAHNADESCGQDAEAAKGERS